MQIKNNEKISIILEFANKQGNNRMKQDMSEKGKREREGGEGEKREKRETRNRSKSQLPLNAAEK